MNSKDLMERLEAAYKGQYTGVNRSDVLAKIESYDPECFPALYAAIRNTFSERFKAMPGPCEIEHAVKYSNDDEDSKPVRRAKPPILKTSYEINAAAWREDLKNQTPAEKEEYEKVGAMFSDWLKKFSTGEYQNQGGNETGIYPKLRLIHSMDDLKEGNG